MTETTNQKNDSDYFGKSPCPQIASALPAWPSAISQKARWFGLYQKENQSFAFTHHPSHSHGLAEMIFPEFQLAQALSEEERQEKLDEANTVEKALEQNSSAGGPISVLIKWAKNIRKRFSGNQHENFDECAEDLFCIPRPEALRLASIILQSRGGSILVTGYRGTGKSSLVNYVISMLIKKEKYDLYDLKHNLQGLDKTDKKEAKKQLNKHKNGFNSSYVPIRINLSTSRTAKAMVLMMIKELYELSVHRRFGDKPLNMIENTYLKSVSSITQGKNVGNSQSRSMGIGVEVGALTGSKVSGGIGTSNEDTNAADISISQTPYSLHEAQQDLHKCLRLLSALGYTVLFIFDELDKLTPNQDDSETISTKKLYDIQQIVSDLKFLLTEANAFHIFIAGKDVDDSWQEDQNKGEGLFESIFIQNIYIPSTFTANLSAALGPHSWIEQGWRDSIASPKVDKQQIGKGDDCLQHLKDPIEYEKWRLEHADAMYETILRELGLFKGSIAYNTGLIVLPHLADFELKRIIIRNVRRVLKGKQVNITDLKSNDTSKFIKVVNEKLSSSTEVTFDELFDTIYQKIEVQQSNGDSQIVFRDGSDSNSDSISLDSFKLLLNKIFTRLDLQSQPSLGISKWLTRELFVEIFSDCDLPREDSNPCDEKSKDSEGRLYRPMTERSVRLLRYTLEYLTYKGRGIPRKILREFYALIQSKDILTQEDMATWQGRSSVEYIMYAPTTVRQKMKFFATIISQLDTHNEMFRQLDDKGCVATFHIIDYILKFYNTGFSWADIENASFMTQREELYPSRELVVNLLKILEDIVVERIDRRQRTYMLLPRIQHDLAGLFQSFGPEQIELRFTYAEFRQEIEELEKITQAATETGAPGRLQSYKAQIRLGEIYELLGNHPAARLEYSKALRWVRLDLSYYWQDESIEIWKEDKTLINYEKSAKKLFTNTNLLTYINYAIMIHQRLGYVHELDREFQEAMHYYLSAARFHEIQMMLSQNEPPSLIDASHTLNAIRNFLNIIRDSENNTNIGFSTLMHAMMLRENFDIIKDKKDQTGKVEETDDYLFRKMGKPKSEEQHDFFEELKKQMREITPGKQLPELLDSNNFVSLLFNEYKKGSSYETYRYDKTMNMIAFTAEKLWDRHMANRYLYFALAYSQVFLKSYTFIDQLIFIGEIFVRRRDIKLATELYLMALRLISEFQISDEKYGTTKRLIPQSTLYAKLLQYLGDLYYASRGSVLINPDTENTSSNFKSDIKARLTSIKSLFANESKKPEIDNNEPDDDEFFYYHAAINYKKNSQPLRAFDVGLKQLEIRKQKIVFNIIDDESDVAKRYWNNYWKLAENLVTSIFDVRPGVRKIQSLDLGRIIDRRRFGLVYSQIGVMFHIMANNPQLLDWYWKLKDNDEEDLQNSAKRIERIIGILTDAEGFEVGSSSSEARLKSDINKTIGLRSPIWHLASGRRNIPATEDWFHVENSFLIGLPYFYLKLGEDSGSNDAASPFIQVSSSNLNNDKLDKKVLKVLKESCDFYFKIRTLYRAEISMLGAYLSMDDNIRDIDCAEASYNLGVLYLSGIRTLLEIRSYYQEQKDNCRDKIKEHENAIAVMYAMYHAAAKRYLVNAIDIYRNEKDHERCFHQWSGKAYRALGDLMLIREEVLICTENKAEKPDKEAVAFSFLPSGLDPKWEGCLQVLKDQSRYIQDTEKEDVRRQVTEAYTRALNEFLQEIEDYIKRYRCPNNVCFEHRNIMNGPMHYSICRAIRNRHVTLDKLQNSDGAGQELFKVEYKLTDLTHRTLPKVHNRNEWLRDIQPIQEASRKYIPYNSYLSIEEKTVVDTKGFAVEFNNEPATKDRDDMLFFRPFNDGLDKVGR